VQRVIICQCAQCKQPIFRGQRIRIIREIQDDDNSQVATTHCDCSNPDKSYDLSTGRKFRITHGVGIR
jgi:hypothetical protein